MHHLEPLSWHLPPAPRMLAATDEPSAPMHAQARSARDADHRAVSRRACLRLIAEFRQACRQSTAPQALATTAKAALEIARIDFELAAAQRSCLPALRSEFRTCLRELDDLVGRLSTGAVLPAAEAAHALDSLLVLLLQIDAAPVHSQAS